jgi:putative membrane protein
LALHIWGQSKTFKHELKKRYSLEEQVRTEKRRSAMKTVSWIGFLLGLAAITLLVASQGAAAIGGRLAVANWKILLLTIFTVPQLALSTWSWRLLFPAGRAPRFPDALLANWVGMSVNLVLPVAGIGGLVVKARLAMRRSVRGIDAVASVVSDKTVFGISTFLWAIVGTVILIRLTQSERVVAPALIGLILMAAALGALLLLLRTGAFGFTGRFAESADRHPKWRPLIERATELVFTLRDLFRRPGAIGKSIGFRLAGRAVLIGETWVAAWLMDYPIGPGEAILLTSFSVAARSLAFVVPAGLGVQEGTMVGVGALIGLSPDAMLAISLAVRLREFAVSVPGVLAWLYLEGWAFWRQPSPAAANPSMPDKTEPGQPPDGG